MFDALTLLSGFIAFSITLLVFVLEGFASRQAMQSTMRHMLGGREDA